MRERVYGKVLTHCLDCGAEIFSFNSRIKDGKGKFCSKACLVKYHKLFTTISLEERLATQCEKSTSCWLWQGKLSNFGYARIKFGQKTVMLHRLVYEYFKGAIPDGLEIDHLCSVRHCVNPEHLEAVTHQINVSRGNTGKYIRRKQYA